MLSEHSPKKSDLFQLYHDYFIIHGLESNQANDFANLMEKLFTNIGSHMIVSLCMNLTDGIGDCVSQYYFNNKFKQLLKSASNADMKSISLVSDDKLKGVKFACENKIPSNEIVVLNGSEKTFQQKYSHIIGIPQTESEKNEINKIINQADFLFNVAIRLNPHESILEIGERGLYNPCTFKMNADDLKKNIYIQSWKEYGFVTRTDNKNSITEEYKTNYTGPVFSQFEMGMHKGQVGLRFIKEIHDAVNEDKIVLFKSLSDELQHKLLLTYENLLFSQFIQNNSFSIGYLQDSDACIHFIELACQTSPENANVNIWINQSWFTQSEHASQYLVGELSKLATSGFSQIELVGHDISPMPDANPEATRTLRLFDFKGISEKDKILLYGLAAATKGSISASGDTSLSELISAGLTHPDYSAALPFIQPFKTKSGTIDSIIRELPCYVGLISEIEMKPNTIYINPIPVGYGMYLSYGFKQPNGEIIDEMDFLENIPTDFPKNIKDIINAKDSTLPVILDIISKKYKLEKPDADYKIASFDDNKLKEKTLYIEAVDDGLKYVAPDDSWKKEYTIPWNMLPENFPRNSEVILAEKHKYLPILLNLIFERNHILEVSFLKENPVADYEKLVNFMNSLNSELSQSKIAQAKENRETIVNSWREFCYFLYNRRNEEQYFKELFVTYTFHHLIKNNCIAECIKLASMLKSDALTRESLLHLAVISNNPDAVKAIIDAKLCDINKPHPFNNYTALHLAVHYNNTNLVKILLANGADRNCIDINGNTALQLAENKKYIEIANELNSQDKKAHPNQFFYFNEKQNSIPDNQDLQSRQNTKKNS